MTGWLRTAGLLLVLGTGTTANPYGGVPAYGVEAGGAGGAPASGAAAHTPSPPPTSASAPASATAPAHALRPAAGPDHHGQAPDQAPDQAPARASAEPSRAGSEAGAGRERPGRTTQPSAEEVEDGGADGEAADENDGASAVPTPADSASPAQEAAVAPSSPPLRPVHQTVTHAEDPTGPVLRILPLGSGLILIGLGLGLAFIGLRVRRG
ncbi:hypothetical protein ACIRU8_38150 [Streptomyces sp. NPDC101175]|uniref:hypothetical protein n=1 Tax=Streptomyces sp. NPDC101175 TaxID=3366123 RepID=UPI003835BAAC